MSTPKKYGEGGQNTRRPLYFNDFPENKMAKFRA